MAVAQYPAVHSTARRRLLRACAACLALIAGLGAFASVRALHAESAAPPDPPVAGRKIINAHEHVDGARQAETLIAMMDRHGIRKTVLMGSSWFTIALYEGVGFSRYDENNDAIVRMAAAHPGRFEAWPTLDPRDPARLEKIQALHARGATGVKLYVGHGYRTRFGNRYMFHTVALDDSGLFPLYAYCAENHVPICMHVNADMPGFADEFVSVLTKFPDLKVNNPHWMMSSIRQSRLRELLDVFPNLHADISFGHDDFLRDGLGRVSRHRDSFRRLIQDYPDRFFFGTDFVITDLRPKSEEWFDVRLRAYYDMLSRETYTTPLLPGQTLRGLALPNDLLENVLFANYERFMASKPKGTKPARPVNWNRMATPRGDRQPGEALPPPAPWSR